MSNTTGNWLSGLSFGYGKSLPLILQTETAECGLACLAMVLGYHGVQTDLATLRTRHAVSLKGMPLERIDLTPKNITQGLEILRDLKNLETILAGNNAWPAEEFWARYDKGEFRK